MKKKNIIDDISIKMMSQSGYGEDELIALIGNVSDINMQGRDGRTLLIHASVYGREKMLEDLIANGADVGIKDELGYTALHAAVSGRNHTIIRMLLAYGAEVDAVDEFGNTPLFRVGNDDPESIRLLISAGADPYKKNNFGISAYDTFAAYPDLLGLMDNKTMQ